MIDIVNYTCSVCKAVVDVVGIHNPTITFKCGHSLEGGAIVHANLKGKVFGESAMNEKRLTLAEIPENHRAAFVSGSMTSKAFKGEDGDPRWWYRDWISYINQWHAEQERLDKERRT